MVMKSKCLAQNQRKNIFEQLLDVFQYLLNAPISVASPHSDVACFDFLFHFAAAYLIINFSAIITYGISLPTSAFCNACPWSNANIVLSKSYHD